MLLRLIDNFAKRFFDQTNLYNLVNVSPLAALPNSYGAVRLNDIFDGFLLATPKNRTPIRKIWSNKYGNDNWKDGTKLFKSKRNIITCMECGNFHEAHTICRACFQKTEEKSRDLIKEKATTLWFEANLAQPTAQAKKVISNPPDISHSEYVVKVKE